MGALRGDAPSRAASLPADPRSRLTRVLGHALWVGLPALALFALSASSPAHAEGRFQAALAALVASVLCGAFGARRVREVGFDLVPAALLAGLAHVVVGGTLMEGVWVAFLAFSVALAASGLAALGRQGAGTPDVPAGAVAVVVLCVAMCGLFWADPVAATLPRERRYRFRQAVVHVDPALALAYDGAAFDRLRSPEVYFEVPLASSLIERPAARTTGLVWLGLGALAWGLVGGIGLIGLARRPSVRQPT